MEKPKWAEHLQPIGVYYEGILDDASDVVERLIIETSSTFGTRRSRRQQPSQVGKENITVNHQDDEVSYIIQCTDIQQQRTNAVDNMKSQYTNEKTVIEK